jgi:SSS family solute:Na+ symporter
MGALGSADLASIGAAAEQILSFGDASVFVKFKELNADKLHTVLPANNPSIPWIVLAVGLWLPNFYYWGLNQYIMQRTLGAASLGEGQKGIVFAAALKRIVPFIIVIPGIIAFNLFKPDMIEAAHTANNQPVLETFAAADPSVSFVDFAFNEDFAQTLRKPPRKSLPTTPTQPTPLRREKPLSNRTPSCFQNCRRASSCRKN